LRIAPRLDTAIHCNWVPSSVIRHPARKIAFKMTQSAGQAVHLTGNQSPRRIAILRALQLGDLLCVVPALRALRVAFPEAHFTLLGLPWARSFVERFRAYLDDFLEFPGFPGLVEQPPALDRLPSFLRDVQARRFDFVLQMHGSGAITNPLAMLCGGQRTAGFYIPSQYCPDPRTFLPYPAREPEIWRHLRLLEFLGIPPQGDHLEFPVGPEDDAALGKVPGVRELRPGGYVCIHAGARAPARRWPAERFASVADGLAACGLQIVLTGSADEMDLVDHLAASMQLPSLNLAGRTSLGALAALLRGCRLLVCNDTGVSHLAAALGIASVVVFTRSEKEGWPPLDRIRHRVVCHIGEVPVEAVFDQALDLLGLKDRQASSIVPKGGTAVTSNGEVAAAVRRRPCSTFQERTLSCVH
jgi:ADP-heptose:LPS heptosyltransferase